MKKKTKKTKNDFVKGFAKTLDCTTEDAEVFCDFLDMFRGLIK